MLNKILAILLFIAFIPTVSLAQNNMPESCIERNKILGYDTGSNDIFMKDHHEKYSQCKINIDSLSNTISKNADNKIYSHSNDNLSHNKKL